MERLTLNQINHLKAIKVFPKSSNMVAFGLRESYDKVQHSFRRLENRELVRRINYGEFGRSKWELTNFGRIVLKQYELKPSSNRTGLTIP